MVITKENAYLLGMGRELSRLDFLTFLVSFLVSFLSRSRVFESWKVSICLEIENFENIFLEFVSSQHFETLKFSSRLVSAKNCLDPAVRSTKF